MSPADALHGPAVASSPHDDATAHDALVARLADARLYLCTDARRERGDLAEFLDAVLAGGVDVVLLRDKGLEVRRCCTWVRTTCRCRWPARSSAPRR